MATGPGGASVGSMFYMHDSAGWGWGWWVLMTVGMVAFWALIVYALVWLARGRPGDRGERTPPEPPPEPPETILKRRLAGGEISLDEYERLRSAIQGEHAEPPAGERRETTAHAT